MDKSEMDKSESRKAACSSSFSIKELLKDKNSSSMCTNGSLSCSFQSATPSYSSSNSDSSNSPQSFEKKEKRFFNKKDERLEAFGTCSSKASKFFKPKFLNPSVSTEPDSDESDKNKTRKRGLNSQLSREESAESEDDEKKMDDPRDNDGDEADCSYSESDEKEEPDEFETDASLSSQNEQALRDQYELYKCFIDQGLSPPANLLDQKAFLKLMASISAQQQEPSSSMYNALMMNWMANISGNNFPSGPFEPKTSLYELKAPNYFQKRMGHPYQNRNPPKRKKPRTSFNRPQIVELEKRFMKQKYLASSERSSLAKILKMTDAQVKTWFQNRRTKWRRQTAEEKEVERQAANKLINSLKQQAQVNTPGSLIFNSECLTAAVAAAAASVNGSVQSSSASSKYFNQYQPSSILASSPGSPPSSSVNAPASHLTSNSQLMEMAAKHLPSLQSPLNRLIMMMDEKNSATSSSP